MPDNVLLQRRLTHKYVGSYQHLDAWRDLGWAKLLGSVKQLRVAHDFDDGGEIGFTVAVPKAVLEQHGRREVERALRDMYSQWGCGHERDCCGCALIRADAKHTKRREFFVRQSIGFNY